MPDAFLTLLRLSVQESEARVARQGERLDEFVAAGRDPTLARKLLATFQATLGLQRRHLKICEAEFAEQQLLAVQEPAKPVLRLVWSRDVQDGAGAGPQKSQHKKR